VGLATFVAASIGCALSRDVHTLVGARLVQAVSIAAIAVVPRAIVRDLHSGDKAPHPDTRRALANAPSDATAIVNAIGRVARHRTRLRRRSWAATCTCGSDGNRTKKGSALKRPARRR
jgi:hypothetical protein